jgi:hypothetical protein
LIDAGDVMAVMGVSGFVEVTGFIGTVEPGVEMIDVGGRPAVIIPGDMVAWGSPRAGVNDVGETLGRMLSKRVRPDAII